MQWYWLAQCCDWHASLEDILHADWLFVDWQAGGGGYEWQVSGQQLLSALPSRPGHPSRDRQPLHFQQPQGKLSNTPKNTPHVYHVDVLCVSRSLLHVHMFRRSWLFFIHLRSLLLRNFLYQSVFPSGKSWNLINSLMYEYTMKLDKVRLNTWLCFLQQDVFVMSRGTVWSYICNVNVCYC